VNTWKVILATMVIFGAGVVTGGLLVRQTQRARLHQPANPPAMLRQLPLGTAGGMRLEFLRRLNRELELTQEQRERIDRILREGQERSRRLMEPVSPRLREEIQRTMEDFRAVLNRAQRERFEELLKQHQQRPREKQNPGADRPPEGGRPPRQAPRTGGTNADGV
jgi:hypothetical protein